MNASADSVVALVAFAALKAVVVEITIDMAIISASGGAVVAVTGINNY
jgi:hypothetical protein